MKKWIIIIALIVYGQIVHAAVDKVYDAPDSVYILPYTTTNDIGRSGLRFAWSPDGERWMSVADGYRYVRSDFGGWKTMIKPRLIKNGNVWGCVWQVSKSGKAFAYVTSDNLIKWNRQTYFMIDDESKSQYISYTSLSLAGVKKQIVLEKDTLVGYMQKLPYKDMLRIIDYGNYRNFQGREDNERTEHDVVRFAGLQSVSANIQLQAEQAKPISDRLIGIFFEDLNYAADGGLYAELIQNRDFEYSSADGSKDKNWNSTYAWNIAGEGTAFSINEDAPIHTNNRHYALLNVLQPGASLMNSGFDGICVKKGEKYDFSMFTKIVSGKGGKIKISLLSRGGEELAQAIMSVTSRTWKKQNAVLIAMNDAEDTVLAISPQQSGTYALDMISLFPQKTFNGRKNGLRADLAQAIADLHPRFMRFPGGCLVHGDGVDNIYDWKGSVGALEARKPLPNIWRYHQTRGLGYYEYFQFCEDIGAEPIPVVAAGVPCQNSGTSSHHSKDEITSEGQQGGIPMEEMGQYIQDILDLIEYANGDARRTKWGTIRAESGHPKPFNLKYIGVGNEDLISEDFEERFIMIYNAVKEKHPEITIIGTVGPACEGTDYEVGWELAKKLNIPIVDEHYYRSPGWFIYHQDFYDNYDRTKSKVYLGEYAAHLKNGPNVETALAEALYLTAIERNADVVSMVSYAPLLAKEGRAQWNPDLIYFNNKEVMPTVGYYVQQMYGLNSGDEYIPSVVRLDNKQDAVKKRIAVSVVRDSKNGDMIIKLVNMLPVNVKAQITLPMFNGMCTKATTTVLNGNPKDKQSFPISGYIDVNENFTYEMSAYSFTVIRIEKVKVV